MTRFPVDAANTGLHSGLISFIHDLSVLHPNEGTISYITPSWTIQHVLSDDRKIQLLKISARSLLPNREMSSPHRIVDPIQELLRALSGITNVEAYFPSGLVPVSKDN